MTRFLEHSERTGTQDGEYASVGKCIYCGAKAPPGMTLGAEHIVAVSLGGRIELPEASCRKCEKITSQFENDCAEGMLGNVRDQLAIGLQRRKTKRTRLRVRKNGHVIKIPIEMHPFYITMQELETPWLRSPPPKGSDSRLIRVRMHTHPDTAARQRALGGVHVLSIIKPSSLRRTMAKISHAYAVAELGSDSFIPFLPGVILGGPQFPEYLVGGIIGDLRATDETSYLRPFHELCLKTEVINGVKYLVCHVTLFANYGMPTYESVVGILRNGENSSEVNKSLITDL